MKPLDTAVIAYANAAFSGQQCERMIVVSTARKTRQQKRFSLIENFWL
jgi:hypothetical protein